MFQIAHIASLHCNCVVIVSCPFCVFHIQDVYYFCPLRDYAGTECIDLFFFLPFLQHVQIHHHEYFLSHICVVFGGINNKYAIIDMLLPS